MASENDEAVVDSDHGTASTGTRITKDHQIGLQAYSIQFCKLCWSHIFSRRLLEQVYRFYHTQKPTRQGEEVDRPSAGYITEWKTLCNSANGGCRWCSYLRHEISSQNGPASRHRKMTVFVLPRLSSDKFNPSGLNLLTVKVTCTRKAQIAQRIRLSQTASLAKKVLAESKAVLFSTILTLAVSEPHNPATKIITSGRPQAITLNRLIESETQRWLQECRSHRQCGRILKSPLPTRVIDVGLTNGPRLIESGRLTDHYVALSYCWGGSQTGVLQKSTLQQYRNYLDVDQMSATIRDAISVTRAIGVPYLWVDAVCIIQDDEDDKDREIAKMSQIYRNAMLTMVIAGCESAATGFLHNRYVSGRIANMPFEINSGSVAEVEIHRYVPHADANEPILRRGWTFQEWILSSRRLIFGTDTMKWHCQEVSENACRTIRNDSWWKSVLTINSLSNCSNDEDIIHCWTYMVRDYSERQLTYSDDKLLAIAAIAEWFSIRTSFKYIAGHFDKFLVEQLLWNIDGQAIMPNGYRAPSWSWASLDGQTNFFYFNVTVFRDAAKPIKIDCQILSSSVDMVFAGNPFGAVRRAVLTVRARTFVVSEQSNSKLEISPDIEGNQLSEEAIGVVLMLRADTMDRLDFWGLLLVPSNRCSWHRVGIVTGPEDMVDKMSYTTLEME